MTPTWILKYNWPKFKEDKNKKWCQEYSGQNILKNLGVLKSTYFYCSYGLTERIFFCHIQSFSMIKKWRIEIIPWIWCQWEKENTNHQDQKNMTYWRNHIHEWSLRNSSTYNCHQKIYRTLNNKHVSLRCTSLKDQNFRLSS